MKNRRSRLSGKTGRVSHIGGLSIKGAHCVPLILCGFCSNNTVYSASLSFAIFIFVLTPFDTWGCKLFGVKSQPVDVYKSVAYKKPCNNVLYSFKHEEATFPHAFVFVFIPQFFGAILSKKCFQKWGRPYRMRGVNWRVQTCSTLCSFSGNFMYILNGSFLKL